MTSAVSSRIYVSSCLPAYKDPYLTGRGINLHLFFTKTSKDHINTFPRTKRNKGILSTFTTFRCRDQDENATTLTQQQTAGINIESQFNAARNYSFPHHMVLRQLFKHTKRLTPT